MNAFGEALELSRLESPRSLDLDLSVDQSTPLEVSCSDTNNEPGTNRDEDPPLFADPGWGSYASNDCRMARNDLRALTWVWLSTGSPTTYVGTTYENVSQTSTNKLGGGSWTDADADGLQAGIQLVAGGTASTVRVTQVVVTVNVGNSVAYTYASGTPGMNTLDSLVKNGVPTSFTYDLNSNLDTK